MILYLSERINYVLSITYNDKLKCPVKPGLRAHSGQKAQKGGQGQCHQISV